MTQKTKLQDQPQPNLTLLCNQRSQLFQNLPGKSNNGGNAVKSCVIESSEKYRVIEASPDMLAEENEESGERAASVVSAKSNISVKSKKSTGQIGERSQSALSVKTNASERSTQSKPSKAPGQHVDHGVKGERAPSCMSCKSNKSKVSDTVVNEPVEIDNNTEERAPSTASAKSCKKCLEEKAERSQSALSAKSNTSVTSRKSKFSDVQSGQVEERPPSTLSIKSGISENEKINPVIVDPAESAETIRSTALADCKDCTKRSSSALSTGSVKSKTSQTLQKECSNERNPSVLSVQSNTSEKRNISEVERSISPVSAKSNSSAKSKESTRSAVQNKSNVSSKVEKEKENNSISQNNTEISDTRVKSSFSDHSNAQSPAKCICGGLMKSNVSENTFNNEERSPSVLSKKSDVSAKSKASSEREPASPSVSIGIVEDYDADNIEEETSMSVTTTPVPCMKSKNEHMQTPCDTPKHSLSARTNASNKSKKSESARSNTAQPASDTVCGMESNESVTKSTKENESSNKEVRSSSKASSVSQSKEKKPDRPKSLSSASPFLEVKVQKSHSKSDLTNAKKAHNTGNTPTKGNEKDTSRPPSEKCLSPGPSKSLNKSKKPAIVLGGSNDSVVSQVVSAPEQQNENSKYLNTTGDMSERTNASERTCSGPPDAIDYGRPASDKTSEKSSKCRNRKGSSSSQQKVDDEISDLVPSSLPNASPTEVVNEWLNKIPLDSTLYDIGDEFHENCEELETPNTTREPTPNARGHEAEGDVAGVFEPQIEKEEIDNSKDKEGNVEKNTKKDLADAGNKQSSLEKDDVPKTFHTSVQVMRVLLSPKLDRCNSLPEVSSVYGQKLSTSARGLLDCLVNLQLIDFDPNDVNGKAEKYKDLMNLLQSLWLSDPSERRTVTHKSESKDQQSVYDELKAKSSSGVDVNSGSSGSGKSSANDSTKTHKSQTNAEGEGFETLTKVQEVDETEGEGLEVADTKSNPATPDIASRVQWTSENEAEGTAEEKLKDSNVPNSDDTIRSNDSPRDQLETPSSSNKSSGNDSTAKQNEAETEHQEDTSSGTPPSVQRAQLTKKASQDPDPVWVLNLLNKLEKQFMTHYVNAMSEFKVRWNLDNNEQLDVMICELRDEVHKRIQFSIDRELRKIQGRAGRPRPPKEAM
uniref:Uncharacterized protein n=1 Tax=Astyanax mexicanus TaxID=7994 RepID=A0A8B9KUF4_ASTMX